MPNLLLSTSGADQLGEVMNLVNRALQHGHLTVEDLSPAAEHAQSEAARLLSELETFQGMHGSEGRYDEAHDETYEEQRVALCVYLDLLGILPGVSIDLLERAQSFDDSRVALLAIASLLNKRFEPAQAAIQQCASSHVVRDHLYTQLKRFNRLDLFPSQYLHLESFAACAMVQWLMCPSELGREPDSLELMAKLEGKSDDGADAIMYLWKCVSAGSAFACANGPYCVNAEMGQLLGGHSFSDFRAWDEATPAEHLADIVDTLENWEVSWCSR
jgi:hypothetical protein